MNYPPPRVGIENPKDFQGDFCQKSENRKSEIKNGRGRDIFATSSLFFYFFILQIAKSLRPHNKCGVTGSGEFRDTKWQI